jgi:hypothetical protein
MEGLDTPTEIKTKLVRDAEAVRKRLEEIRARAGKSKELHIVKDLTEEVTAGLSQARHVGAKAMEFIAELQDGQERNLESLQTLHEAAEIASGKIEDLGDHAKKSNEETLLLREEHQETKKAVKSNSAKSDTALNLAQKSQLEASARWIIIKNVPMANKDKESYTERYEATIEILEGLGIANLVSVTGVQRLLKREGADPKQPPNLRVQVAGEQQRRVIFDSVERATRAGHPPTQTFAADIPAYAKKRFKEMNALSKLCRDLDRSKRTRVMLKSNWPHLYIKEEAGGRYLPATDETIAKLRTENKNMREKAKKGKPAGSKPQHSQAQAQSSSSHDNQEVMDLDDPALEVEFNTAGLAPPPTKKGKGVGKSSGATSKPGSRTSSRAGKPSH